MACPITNEYVQSIEATPTSVPVASRWGFNPTFPPKIRCPQPPSCSEYANVATMDHCACTTTTMCPSPTTHHVCNHLQLMRAPPYIHACTTLHSYVHHPSPMRAHLPPICEHSHSSNMHQTPPTSRTHIYAFNTVFLPCGIKNPAFDSRIHLLMAGDIESNPGPASSTAVVCRGCGKTIRSDKDGEIISVICGTCSGHFHKNHTKIQKREDQDEAMNNPGSWKCYLCCAPAQEESIPDDDLPRAACKRPNCHCPIKQGDPRVTCGTCSDSYHMGCMGIKFRKDQNAKANQHGSWTCPKCRGMLTEEERTSKSKSVKCGVTGCKRPVYTKNLFITCGTCEKAFHKGCTGIESRTDQDRAARQVGSTQCLQCQAANAPDSVKKNELGSENSSRIRGFKQKQLRILQWNANQTA